MLTIFSEFICFTGALGALMLLCLLADFTRYALTGRLPVERGNK